MLWLLERVCEGLFGLFERLWVQLGVCLNGCGCKAGLFERLLMQGNAV